MTNTLGLAAIPWRWVDADLTQFWYWDTPHFQVKITGEMNSFHWELGDLVVSNEGYPRFLNEGRAATFNQAELEIREAVGKSYPPEYGYRKYAGALATTFRIATREAVNFGELDGRRAVVTVRTPNGHDQGYSGTLRVSHYEITMTDERGQLVKIQPAHIVKVVGETGGGNLAANKNGYTGSGRIYFARGPVPGCTGKPGFLPGTVDHTGPACPIHEDVPSRLSGKANVPPVRRKP